MNEELKMIRSTANVTAQPPNVMFPFDRDNQLELVVRQELQVVANMTTDAGMEAHSGIDKDASSSPPRPAN